MAKKKYVYFFGAGKGEGKGEMKNLLIVSVLPMERVQLMK
mgnify:CR=1 FL=1